MRKSIQSISRQKNNQKYFYKYLRGKWLLVIAFLMISLLYGCGIHNKQTESTNVKKVIVGIDKFEPYTYLDADGNFTGIDIELAKIIFHKLGYEPEFQFIPWSEKNTYLEDGTIDCIWSCYSMNDREDDYKWAGPYLYSRQVIAVSSDSNIRTFNDLTGKLVGVQATTRASDLFLHKIDSPLPQVKQVNCFATTEDMFAAIRKGYVDAISGHEALLNELIKSGDGEFRLLSESPHISRVGVAFKKGTHAALTQKMNEIIKEMSEDGTIGNIAGKYGLDADKVVVGGESDGK